MSERYRAAVLLRPGEIRLEERPLHPPGPGEVRVRVRACAMCGSDLHLYEGTFPRARFPLVMGHEFAGVVDAVGEGVEGVVPGQRACLENHLACWRCVHCREGRSNLCLNARSVGFTTDGAYADYAWVPAESVVSLPEGVPFEVGAVMQTLGTSYHAVVRRARVEAGESVAVLGAGPVGLCAAAVARAAGARVLAIDLAPHRLEAARRMGAEEVVDPSREDPVEAVRRWAGGLGADKVIEAVGGRQRATLAQAVRMARRGGRVVVVGSFAGEGPPIPAQELQDEEKELVGSRGHPGTFPICLDLVARGAIELAALISHRLPLEEVGRGIELMRSCADGVLKVVLEP